MGTSLTLNDITLDAAYATDGDGSAIRASGPLTLNNVTIQNSQTTAAYCGAAIWSNSTVNISNSTFNKNTGGSGGGAICSGSINPTTILITNSSFTNNKTVDPVLGFGGAILVNNNANLTVVDTSFTSNSAHFGGALAVRQGGTATLRTQNPANKVLFLTNSATEDGGAIYNQGTLSIYQAELNANQTPQNTLLAGYGGGIHNQGTLTLHDSLLSVNLGRYGGGLFVGNNPNAQAEVQRTRFDLNSAGLFGGGLYTNTGGNVTVANSSFRLNKAASGAGVARFNARLDISDSSITDNQATGVGGGLYSGAGPASDPTFLSATSVTIGGNTAGGNLGGGIYTAGYSVFKNLTIKDNTNGLL